MARRILAVGRLFGGVGPARIEVAPGDDVVRAYAPVQALVWGVGSSAVDRAFEKADWKLMELVHESRGRRRG